MYLIFENEYKKSLRLGLAEFDQHLCHNLHAVSIPECPDFPS